jgi:hypothetical protein
MVARSIASSCSMDRASRRAAMIPAAPSGHRSRPAGRIKTADAAETHKHPGATTPEVIVIGAGLANLRPQRHVVHARKPCAAAIFAGIAHINDTSSLARDSVTMVERIRRLIE